MTSLEIFANAFNLISVIFAARNSIHTWWSGIVGCLLLGALFLQSKLYADVTLQGFFIVTSIMGWSRWLSRRSVPDMPIESSPKKTLAMLFALSVATSIFYATLL